MELVYLWVEDYQNIKKQWFNFSPRFRCEYDDEKHKFSICDKKNEECDENSFINIFPNNINVMSIVGKNGSGKNDMWPLKIKKNL